MNDYPSQPLCQQLANVGIDFPESEKVWVNGFICETYNTMSFPTSVLRKHWHGEFSIETRDNLYVALKTPHKGVDILPAPSLAELLERLIHIDPIHFHFYSTGRVKVHTVLKEKREVIEADTPQNAAAQMLLKLKENNSD